MTQQLLDAAQVGAALEQVGARAVPEPVRTKIGGSGDVGEPPVHDRPGRARVEAPPAPLSGEAA